MTRHRCYFAGCGKTNEEPGITLHRFIVHIQQTRNDWLMKSGHESLYALTDQQLHEKRVCSSHFQDSDFTFRGVGKKNRNKYS
ncbi:hypothetical protein TKK_0002889 [Trichogramma kaykai]